MRAFQRSTFTPRRLPGEQPEGLALPAVVDRQITFDLSRLREDGARGLAAPQVQAVQDAASSSGQALPSRARGEFERSLGVDLSGVRLHVGEASARAADLLHARAFTSGQDIHFNAGQYRPGTRAGDDLLAHEVAHTVQQGPGARGPTATSEVSRPGDRHERAAHGFVDAWRGGRQVQASALGRVSGEQIQREPLPVFDFPVGLALRVQAVGRMREAPAPQSPAGRTALLTNTLGQVIGQQLPGGVFRFNDGNELRTEGEPLFLGGFPLRQPVRSLKPTGVDAVVASDYKQAPDGSFTAKYEFFKDSPGAGEAVLLPLSRDDAALPVSLRGSIGSPEYYQLRVADFKRRNPDKPPPTYYLQYGDKYLHRFLGKLSRLSPKGQEWLKSTLKNLQRLIEDKRDADPAAYAKLELDDDAATDFYYDTHPEAYIVSGLASLPPRDLLEIASTPDKEDLTTFRGLLQIVKVALVVGPAGESAPEHYGGPRP